MSFALDPTLLTLAVVAAAVGSLHDASSTTCMVAVAVAVTMAVMARVRIGNTVPRLVEEHQAQHSKSCHTGKTQL